MSVQWGEPQRAAQERAEADSSMRALVYYVLIPASATIAIGLAWLALKIGG